MTHKESDEEAKHGVKSKDPQSDSFWIEFGKNNVAQTIDNLDERTKFMITTCAALIVANFGILTISHNLSIVTITPQFFLAVSTTFFVLSYFPIKKTYGFDEPDKIRKTYDSWIKWKLYWQYGGYALFITGLVLIGLLSIK